MSRLVLFSSFLVIFLMACGGAKKPTQADIWQQQVEQRIQRRSAHAVPQESHEWGRAESIMNRPVTQAFVQSMNRLERRYPGAFPQSATYLGEVRSALLALTPNTSEKRLKKEAAFRFLDRVSQSFYLDQNRDYSYPMTSYSQAPGGEGNVEQVIALVWAAVRDEGVYRTSQEREERKWGLLDSLARIQRAHNEKSDGSIEWSFALAADQPSCQSGTFIRLLESLDHNHPDVRINSVLQSAVDPLNRAAVLAAEPSADQVAGDLLGKHREIFPLFLVSLNEAEREEFLELAESYEERIQESETYQRYVQALRSAVKADSPAISEHALVQQTGFLSVCALINS